MLQVVRERRLRFATGRSSCWEPQRADDSVRRLTLELSGGGAVRLDELLARFTLANQNESRVDAPAKLEALDVRVDGQQEAELRNATDDEHGR